jgi:hypothetical protein
MKAKDWLVLPTTAGQRLSFILYPLTFRLYPLTFTL